MNVRVIVVDTGGLIVIVNQNLVPKGWGESVLTAIEIVDLALAAATYTFKSVNNNVRNIKTVKLRMKDNFK